MLPNEDMQAFENNTRIERRSHESQETVLITLVVVYGEKGAVNIPKEERPLGS